MMDMVGASAFLKFKTLRLTGNSSQTKRCRLQQIRLSKGLYALVDSEDYDWLMQWTWYASNESRGTKWYAIRRENGKKIRMHVAVWVRHNGPVPKGLVIDHVNHNSLDNRKFISEKFDEAALEAKIADVAYDLKRCFYFSSGARWYHGINNENKKPQLEAITQVENMKRSPGFKQKGQKYGSKKPCEARAET